MEKIVLQNSTLQIGKKTLNLNNSTLSNNQSLNGQELTDSNIYSLLSSLKKLYGDDLNYNKQIALMQLEILNHISSQNTNMYNKEITNLRNYLNAIVNNNKIFKQGELGDLVGGLWDITKTTNIVNNTRNNYTLSNLSKNQQILQKNQETNNNFTISKLQKSSEDKAQVLFDNFMKNMNNKPVSPVKTQPFTITVNNKQFTIQTSDPERYKDLKNNTDSTIYALLAATSQEYGTDKKHNKEIAELQHNILQAGSRDFDKKYGLETDAMQDKLGNVIIYGNAPSSNLLQSTMPKLYADQGVLNKNKMNNDSQIGSRPGLTELTFEVNGGTFQFKTSAPEKYKDLFKLNLNDNGIYDLFNALTKEYTTSKSYVNRYIAQKQIELLNKFSSQVKNNYNNNFTALTEFLKGIVKTQEFNFSHLPQKLLPITYTQDQKVSTNVNTNNQQKSVVLPNKIENIALTQKPLSDNEIYSIFQQVKDTPNKNTADNLLKLFGSLSRLATALYNDELGKLRKFLRDISTGVNNNQNYKSLIKFMPKQNISSFISQSNSNHSNSNRL